MFAAQPRVPLWPDWAGAIFWASWSMAILVTAPRLSLALLPVLAHEMFSTICFLIRRKPRPHITRWHARVCAYTATFLLPVFIFFANRWRPAWMAPTAIPQICLWGKLFWLFGSIFMLFSMWSLRYSFSVEPQARELVTKGPYRIARHPLYFSYAFQYGGILLLHFTPVFLAFYCAWLIAMVTRAKLEERVLQSVFPDYSAYKKQVAMFSPKASVALTEFS